MLGKLIKYDIKSEFRLFVGMYIFVFILALISMISGKVSDANSASLLWSNVNLISTVFMFIGMAATYIITFIICVLRYRRNLLKDEGYLMHTLPVSKTALFASKLISSYMWVVIDVVVCFLAYSLSVLDMGWFGDFWQGLSDGMMEGGVNVHEGSSIAWFVVFMIVASIAGLCQFFASLTIGYSIQLNNQNGVNKDILSIVAYICIYVVQQLLTLIGIGCVVVGHGIDITENLENSGQVVDYMEGIFRANTFIMATLIVVFSIVSVRLMNKKLNLE